MLVELLVQILALLVRWIHQAFLREIRNSLRMLADWFRPQVHRCPQDVGGTRIRRPPLLVFLLRIPALRLLFQTTFLGMHADFRGSQTDPRRIVDFLRWNSALLSGYQTDPRRLAD